MDAGLKNKVALVAASSRGLGKAAALKLSEEEAKVVICARNKERLLKARDEISIQTGNPVWAFTADVTNTEQIKNMIHQISEEIGPVEILVCNAGGPPAGLIEDFSPEDYQSALRLNLMSTITLCYEVIPTMKSQKWGRIIIIASVSAKQPIQTLILSNTARAGVLGFSKSLSNQLAPFGITVNSVCPGYTKTERVEELAKSFSEKKNVAIDEFYSQIEKSIPMARLGDPQELAHAILFLASKNAGYITGVSLQVDGGYIQSLY